GPVQLVGDVPPDDGNRPQRVDLHRADEPPALDVEGAEIDVFGRHAHDLRAVHRLAAKRHRRRRVGLRGDRAHVVAEPLDRRRLGQLDAGIVADAILVGLRADRRHPLNREVVDADARLDRVGDVGVHPLDERHHRDDGSDRHDVPEHGQERSQLVLPDRAQRDAGGFQELVHPAYFFTTPDVLPGAASIFIGAPSRGSRTELNGPTMTWSPAFTPERPSKYFSPAMPVLIGANTALLSFAMKTPSSSLRSWPGFSSCAWTVLPGRPF